MKVKNILLFITFALFFIFGCIRITKDLGTLVERKNITMTPERTLYDFSHCQAFICDSKPGILEAVLFWKEPKFKLKECKFQNFDPMNKKDVEELKKMLYADSGKHVKEVMFGIGPSLATGDEAQRFCGSIGFVIHDLGGNRTEDPSTINKDWLKPFLDSEIIPMLLYTPREHRFNFSRDLAKNISKIDGPVILALRDYTTSSLSPFNIKNYEEINNSCKKCLISSYIQYNETTQLETHNTTPGIAAGTKVIDYIDIVTYEISLNDFGCDKYEALEAMMNFSEYILDNYMKPTIIVINVTEDANCTERKIAESFDYILSSIPFLSQVGVIGIAHYDLAWFFRDNGAPKAEPFNAWFANCRHYYTAQEAEKVRKVAAIYPIGRDKFLSLCPALFPVSVEMILKCEYLNISNVEPADLNESFEPDLLFPPNLIDGDLSRIEKTSIRALDGYEKVCERWSSQLREFTSHYQFDYAFVRAVVWKENKFVSHTEYANIPPLNPREKVDKYCERYSSVNYLICNGVERLKYYYDLGVNTTNTLNNSGYLTKQYFPYYLSYYGYKNGISAFNQLIESYKRCIDNENAQKQQNKDYQPNYDGCINSRSHFGDPEILKIFSDTNTIRELCFKNKFIGTSETPPWTDSFKENLTSPLKNPKCIVDFNENMGVYWNSGLILKDESENRDVFSATNGTVTEIGESPRFGKYIIISYRNYVIRYSGLSQILVSKNDKVKEGDKIGETTDFLRFEICDDSNQKCKFSLVAKIKDRKFLDPKGALGIKCG